MVKAADMLIARRADTRARADFATWKMMAKLNGLSALPTEAQQFLASYKKLLEEMSEAEATETAINLVYKSYYAEMGGGGKPPDIRSRPSLPTADNVTAFRRPAAAKPKKATPFRAAAFGTSGTSDRPRLPVALIFICLAAIYVTIRYFWL